MLEEKVCKLPRCSELFKPGHGNMAYCCQEHQAEDKLDEQKKKRDPIKHFIPILMKNHRKIESMVKNGLTEVNDTMLESYGVDFSMLRPVKPATGVEGEIVLDSGVFFLITDINFKNFKIQKHEPNSYTGG